MFKRLNNRVPPNHDDRCTRSCNEPAEISAHGSSSHNRDSWPACRLRHFLILSVPDHRQYLFNSSGSTFF